MFCQNWCLTYFGSSLCAEQLIHLKLSSSLQSFFLSLVLHNSLDTLCKFFFFFIKHICYLPLFAGCTLSSLCSAHMHVFSWWLHWPSCNRRVMIDPLINHTSCQRPWSHYMCSEEDYHLNQMVANRGVTRTLQGAAYICTCWGGYMERLWSIAQVRMCKKEVIIWLKNIYPHVVVSCIWTLWFCD